MCRCVREELLEGGIETEVLLHSLHQAPWWSTYGGPCGRPQSSQPQYRAPNILGATMPLTRQLV